MDEELWQYYNDRRPSQHILNARAETIEALTKAVNAYAQIICTGKSKHDRYQVATFGSTLVGSDEASSDLDVVVLDPAYETGWRPDIVWTKKPSAMYDIEKLSRFFQRRGFYNLEAIPKARVPILSGRSASTPSVHFDLSVNSRNGLFNSQLIAEYAKVHPHVRPLLVLLKAWSRGNKLDAPAKLVQRGRGRQIGMPRPLSSYIMSNIVVAYMQHEGMLPNLQEPYVSPLFNEDDWSQTALAGDNAKSAYDILRRPPFAKKEHIWWSISRRDTNTRIPHDLRHLDADSAPVRAWIERRRRRMENSGEHERSLADTLRGFFRFFGRDFAYGLQVVSVRDGGIAPRQRQPGWRSPDRFLAQLHRDLVYGAQLPRDGKIPSESLNLDPYRWLREGDSREVDEDIERETARLLAMSTDVESFKSAQFVAIDPIFSEVNLGENFHNAFMKKFVGQCARAENVFSTGLGIRELLATSSSGFVKR
ncbi:Nucleotidyltransferase [Auriculariales sp. MPI-PUGE-AT-0066]|nr:Nucleotidyltransferase [Auriculariales sp. MPI-PUGE-AT-0066]